MKSQRRYPQGVSSPSRSLWLRIWNADLSRRARPAPVMGEPSGHSFRSEEHTSELQSLTNLVCRLLLEKKKNKATHSSGRSAARAPLGTQRHLASRHVRRPPVSLRDLVHSAPPTRPTYPSSHC